MGSHEVIFELRSRATGRKNSEVRFHRWLFAGQRIKSQHALNIVDAPGGLSGAHGYYDNTTGQIQLNKADIEALESSLGGKSTDEEKLQSLLPTYMTLLHETVHYGDYLDGLRQDGGEPGVDFELEVWGIKGKNDDGSTFTVARFFPEKYQDKQTLINSINEYLNNGQKDILPTVPKKE